jgi:hypothetical protein
LGPTRLELVRQDRCPRFGYSVPFDLGKAPPLVHPVGGLDNVGDVATPAAGFEGSAFLEPVSGESITEQPVGGARRSLMIWGDGAAELLDLPQAWILGDEPHRCDRVAEGAGQPREVRSVVDEFRMGCEHRSADTRQPILEVLSPHVSTLRPRATAARQWASTLNPPFSEKDSSGAV